MAGGSNRGRHHIRTIDKIHLLVRLELANPLMSSSDVAALAGIKIGRFTMMKRLPLYQQIHNQYMSGIVTRLDSQVDRNFKLGQETLKFAVPLALQGLVAQALHAKDERVKNKAMNDLLDREGSFAKVSRTSLTVTEATASATDKDNETAAQLLDALKKQKELINTPDPLTDTIQ